MKAVRFSRLLLAVVAVAVSTACASAARHAPRPFPTAPSPAEVTGTASAPDARSAVTTDVLSTAMDLLGTPYRLGGTDPSGFDCSGFVQFVLARHAVPMPRTVIQQFAVGAPTRDVEAGDRVFFQTAGRRASHVGIAIDGESFVHAPSSRGVVRVERLDAPYWASRYLGARRIF